MIGKESNNLSLDSEDFEFPKERKRRGESLVSFILRVFR